MVEFREAIIQPTKKINLWSKIPQYVSALLPQVILQCFGLALLGFQQGNRKRRGYMGKIKLMEQTIQVEITTSRERKQGCNILFLDFLILNLLVSSHNGFSSLFSCRGFIVALL